ncbi:acetyl-CoA carboxylase biotin carboxyl carrier protein subunit [Dyadobacter bucti]|jgi:acetyl/propionyl-CoA carboxylase alpha subunit|uniref:acetyl-CoA carboxylase biotin carboxyl carrier protein subunit n=1 Tax=Dyadobacter bucti TaxID=2572203 RepID=UPI001108353F|nr:acetyl-CoA carboxylase biotin carboxyl carrier protein subunit [Dyadobacter bucti]
MLKITVSGDPDTSSGDNGISFHVSRDKDQWFVGNELFEADVVELSKNHFHVIRKNKSYNIEIIGSDPIEKTTHLIINGQHYHTNTKDQLDLLLEGMGMQSNAAPKLNNIKAPMPGLIQSVSISEGDEVAKGDSLLVLVAMKMENVIKAAGNGKIKALKVKAGEIVEKNQVLLEFQ